MIVYISVKITFLSSEVELSDKYIYLDGKGLWELLPEIQKNTSTLSQITSVIFISQNSLWSEYFIAYILNKIGPVLDIGLHYIKLMVLKWA